MKRSRLLLSAAALAASAGLAHAQVFSSSTVPVVTVDETTVSDTITVAGGPAVISDVNLILRLTHTWDSDLDIILQGPGGFIQLTSDNGGSGDNYVTTRFDDIAPTSVTAGAAPFSGNFRPEGVLNGLIEIPPVTGLNYLTLSQFIGQNANTAWTLYITDDAGGDSGTLTYWSLEFNGAVDSNGPAPVTGSVPPGGEGTYVGCIFEPGDTIPLQFNVVPGANPTSTFANPGSGVTVDGSPINAGTVTLFDDGMHNDGAANDRVYGGSIVVGAGTTPDVYDLPVTVTDDQGRTASRTITDVFVDDFTGQLPASATDFPGTSAMGMIDIDQGVMWRIEICDPASFTATSNNAGTDFDTQLWLFDSTGAALATNDDSVGGDDVTSTLSNTFVPGPGIYYLAITGFDRDPVNSDCADIFEDQPYREERAPDGPGAANRVVVGWYGGFSGDFGSYEVTITGAGTPGSCGGNPCEADLNGDGNVDQGDVDCIIAAAAGDPSCLRTDIPVNTDLNQDGNVDQGDVDTEINIVAGAPCP